jgi:chromosome partitioning protein
VLGRRRGRNRPTAQDDFYPVTEPEIEPGSIKLVEDSSDSSSDSSSAPAEASQGQPSPAGPPPRMPTPIKKTSSDVATAHAELDSVLPPSGMDRVVELTNAGVSSVTPDVRQGGSPEQAVASPATIEEVDLEVSVSDEPIEADNQPSYPSPEVEVEVEQIAATGSDEGVQAASRNPLPRVMAVANQKGGVGKTTTSVNLGAALAELGFRVLVIDLDPQGNATTGLGIDARNFELSMYDVMMRDASLEDCVEPTSMKNLFVAPATIALAGAEIELVPAFSRELKLKRSIESVLDDFDYVLIDCPPSLGLITVNALAAADEVLVPIQCEYYALEGLSQLMRNVHLVASNLNPQLDISTIVLTMYDARTKLADQVANEVRQHFGSKVCRSVIPRTVRLSEAPSFGQPITAFDPTSRGAIAYRELAKEVSGGAS